MNHSSRAMAFVVMGLVLAASASGATLGQKDTFQTLGNTLGWAGGDGINVPTPISAQQIATGGADGPADGYLQIGSNAYHLGTKNAVQWTGDFLSAGITGIEMDANHFGTGGDDVELRVLINGPGGLFASTNLTATLVRDTWAPLSFGLTAADLVYVSGGTNNLASTLSAVSQLQVRHDYPTPTPPGGHPEHVTATLGLDNIQAVPEPASLVLLAIGGAAMLRRRKR